MSVREPLVPPALGRRRDELLVPEMHLRQVGVAALRERAQQVERRGRLVVALDHPLAGPARAPRRCARRRAPCGRGSSADLLAVDALERSERGFVNWPAIRPTFTTGSVAPYVSTADICSMIFSFSRMRIVESSLNDSTQSPACSRKARPSITRASRSRSSRASPAKTSGGLAFRRSSDGAGLDGVRPLGLLERRCSRQESGDQVRDVTAISPV